MGVSTSSEKSQRGDGNGSKIIAVGMQIGDAWSVVTDFATGRDYLVRGGRQEGMVLDGKLFGFRIPVQPAAPD